MPFCRLSLNLLPKNLLLKTSELDKAVWNYKPVLGFIQRQRFRLIKQLLTAQQYNRILEVGYGSGIFIPELQKYCHEIYGIDIHHEHKKIIDLLKKIKIDAKLIRASATAIPFDQDYFDCIIAVSAIEFIKDLDKAFLEFKRVLKSNGCLIFVTPGHSKVVDLGLKLLTGEKAEDNYGDRRQYLHKSLTDYFEVQKKITFPGFKTSAFLLYSAYRLKPK